MNRIISSSVLGGIALLLVGCGGSATIGAGGKVELPPTERSGFKTSTGDQVHKEAAKDFDDALKVFVAHDKSFDWNEASCKDTADLFVKSSQAQKGATNRAFPAALYNAGLSYQRCEKDAEALQHFKLAVEADRSFHRAAAQLALYDYQKGGSNLDSTIDKLNQIIRDAKFQNADALVGVAALQMERQSESSDSDGKNDLERAVKNIQRALAIDDTFMPAFNQLSLYYLNQAKAKAGKKSSGRRGGLVVSGVTAKNIDQQMLDLA